jgi:hypothetical protein
MQINGCADTASSSIVGSQQPATLFGKRLFTAGVFIAPLVSARFAPIAFRSLSSINDAVCRVPYIAIGPLRK